MKEYLKHQSIVLILVVIIFAVLAIVPHIQTMSRECEAGYETVKIFEGTNVIPNPPTTYAEYCELGRVMIERVNGGTQ